MRPQGIYWACRKIFIEENPSPAIFLEKSCVTLSNFKSYRP